METLGGLASPNTVSSAGVNSPTHLKPTTSKDIGRPNVDRTKVLRTRCRKDATQKRQNVERDTMGKGNYTVKKANGNQRYDSNFPLPLLENPTRGSEQK